MNQRTRMNGYCTIILLMSFGLTLNTTAFAQSDKGPLDDAGLKTMLDNLGYEFKERTKKSGTTIFEIAEKAGAVTCFILIELSSDKKNLWVSCGFGFIPKDKPIPREILVQLLGANYNSAFMKFAYNPKTRHLRLEHSFLNDGVTPRELRKSIDRIVEMTEKYENLWSSKKWPTEDVPASDEKADDQKDSPK